MVVINICSYINIYINGDVNNIDRDTKIYKQGCKQVVTSK